MTEPLLSVRHLTKVFAGRGWQASSCHAVSDVSFDIMPGETFALVGESGSGKSTTGRCLVGLTAPTAGEVLFCGQSLLNRSAGQWKPLRQQIQMVFQDPLSTLDPKHSIGYSVEEPLIIQGSLDRRARQHRVADILKRVGLKAADGGRFPYEFSGGQRQRIGIARALIVKPQLLICDEPVSALDVSVQSQILNLLMDLQRTDNISYLFISHDLGVVHQIADRVGVMYQGEIVENAPTEQLFHQPGHRYTRQLLEAVLPAHPDQRKVWSV